MTLEGRDRDRRREEDQEQAWANNTGSADPGWLSIGMAEFGDEGAALAIIAVGIAAAGYGAVKVGRWVRGLFSDGENDWSRTRHRAWEGSRMSPERAIGFSWTDMPTACLPARVPRLSMTQKDLASSPGGSSRSLAGTRSGIVRADPE